MSKWDMYRPKLVNGKRVATGEYRSWQMMKNRCTNVKAGDYKHYGGRGIRIAPEWDSFDAFMDDMGPKPYPEATLDREDGDGDYCAANCKWASRTEQARNRKYTLRIRGFKTWDIATQCGIKMASFHHRLWLIKTRGLPFGRAFCVDRLDNPRRYL